MRYHAVNESSGVAIYKHFQELFPCLRQFVVNGIFTATGLTETEFLLLFCQARVRRRSANRIMS